MIYQKHDIISHNRIPNKYFYVADKSSSEYIIIPIYKNPSIKAEQIYNAYFIEDEFILITDIFREDQ